MGERRNSIDVRRLNLTLSRNEPVSQVPDHIQIMVFRIIQ